MEPIAIIDLALSLSCQLGNADERYSLPISATPANAAALDIIMTQLRANANAGW